MSILKNENLKEYLKFIYYSKGVTHEEFCLKVKGSVACKNKWLRFLVHHNYVYKNKKNTFCLSESGKQLLKNIMTKEKN